MSISRKIKRSHKIKSLKSLGIMCCGQVMTCKEYGVDKDHDLWFCEKCGKEKVSLHLN